MQKKDLISFLDSILKPFGFARKGNSWRMEGNEITKIVNLQKSSFGNQYYINYGYNVNGLDYDGTSMHIFRGLTMSDGKGVQLLDFDNALDAEHRDNQITEKLQGLLSGELNEINTVEELKMNLRSRGHLNDVPIKLKEYLSLSAD